MFLVLNILMYARWPFQICRFFGNAPQFGRNPSPSSYPHVARRRKTLSSDAHLLTEQQVGIHLSRLPQSWTEETIVKHLRDVLNVDFHDESVLIMKTKIGESTGKALILIEGKESPKLQTFIDSLPDGVDLQPFDTSQTRAFVERCERMVSFSEDIQRISEPGNFLKVVTLSGIPELYGRVEVARFIQNHVNVNIDPKNIIFSFTRWGDQSKCFVLCNSYLDAKLILDKIKETPAPKRVVYGAKFGCSFVSADRSTMFLSMPSLNNVLYGSKYWVATLGWKQQLAEKEVLNILNKQKVFPCEIKVIPISADNTNAFLLRFERMRDVKQVIGRLHDMRLRWHLPKSVPFYAYPATADVHWKGDKIHEDARRDYDGDLDEPVEY